MTDISPPPTLESPRLVLRPVGSSDWPQILQLRSDPRVNALVKRPLAKTREDALAFIEKVDKGNQSADMIYWGIVLPEVNEVMGSICLWKFAADRKQAEVGYDLSVASQGKGYMTEAMRAVLDFGITRLGLSKVEAYTQSNNVASIKLLDKFGFARLVDRVDKTNSLNTVFALSAEKYLSLRD